MVTCVHVTHIVAARANARANERRERRRRKKRLSSTLFRRIRASAARARDTRVVQIRCWDESTHCDDLTMFSQPPQLATTPKEKSSIFQKNHLSSCGYLMHASLTQRTGALNASVAHHDRKTTIKKYVYNPGRVTFANFCEAFFHVKPDPGPKSRVMTRETCEKTRKVGKF